MIEEHTSLILAVIGRPKRTAERQVIYALPQLNPVGSLRIVKRQNRPGIRGASRLQPNLQAAAAGCIRRHSCKWFLADHHSVIAKEQPSPVGIPRYVVLWVERKGPQTGVQCGYQHQHAKPSKQYLQS